MFQCRYFSQHINNSIQVYMQTSNSDLREICKLYINISPLKYFEEIQENMERLLHGLDLLNYTLF